MYPLLAGLRIIDITTILLGPFATQILGDLGADVIKIETTEGELNRSTPPAMANGIGASFANNNRNKRSLALDLKTADGKAILARLLGTADALVHNMRQDAIDRLGFGFETVKALNPRIVYCAALGYGSDGPYSGRPAFDDIIQCAGGIAGLEQLRDGEPAYAPSVIADKAGALHVVYAVLAALLYRERTKGGAMLVEMPMFEAIAAFAMNENLMAATFEDNGATGYHRTLSRNRKPYRTQDGWIGVLPYTPAQWTRMLELIDRHDIIAEPWFRDNAQRSKRVDELYRILADALRSRTSEAWLTALLAADIPCGRCNTPDDLLRDPHLEAVGFFTPNFAEPTPIRRTLRQPVLFRDVARKADRAAPPLGADTRTLMSELGYGDADIAALAKAGIVRGV